MMLLAIFGLTVMVVWVVWIVRQWGREDRREQQAWTVHHQVLETTMRQAEDDAIATDPTYAAWKLTQCHLRSLIIISGSK